VILTDVEGVPGLSLLSAPAGVVLYGLRYVLDTAPADAVLATLSDAERKRASGFARLQDRVRFVETRYALRKLLGERLGCAPAEVKIVFGPHEKPELAPPRTCHFNLAHSRERGLIAIAPTPVGVDVEWIDTGIDWPPLATRVLHPEERAVLDAMGSDDRVRGFFTHWARKEAVLKALGTGFYTESRSFAVPLGSVTIAAPASGGLPGPPAQLHVSSIELDPDYCAAVATREALS
jgi:4'-phosphopantetheinyl transferase